MSRRHRNPRLPLLLCVVLLLSACGQKGPLYLEPDPDEEKQTQSAS